MKDDEPTPSRATGRGVAGRQAAGRGEAGSRQVDARRDDGGPEPTPRSWLFVPGAAERYVAKLADVRPDAAILDLEDGISARDVEASRSRVAAVLRADRVDTALPPIVAVRSHPVSSTEFENDCAALGPRLDVLMLPKVAEAAEVREAAARLEAAGLAHVRLVVMIESARGLENLASILSAHQNLVGVAFGAEDFAADIGLPPQVVGRGDAASRGEGARGASRAAGESGRLAVLDAVRTRLVTTAAAAGVPWRIDTPVLRLRPLSLVEAEARRSRSMGFGGKFVIHPSHVQPVHDGYAPSAAEIAWARAVLGGGADGAGVARPAADAVDAARTSGGAPDAAQMVDEAVARQARAVLRSAERTSSEASGEGLRHPSQDL